MSERVYPRGLAPGQHCPCNGTGVIEHSAESLEVCEHPVYFTDGLPSQGLDTPVDILYRQVAAPGAGGDTKDLIVAKARGKKRSEGGAS